MKPMNLSQKISSLADRDFTVLDENLTIDVGAKIMRGKGSTCIIVINYRSGKPTGIITERDILYRIVAENRAPSKTELKKLVNSPLITIDEESSLKDAISLMMKKGIRRLPVMHGDNIIGIVNVMSVIGHIYEEKTDVGGETEGSTLNLLVKDTILTCPYCQSIFKDKAEMSKHIDRIHVGSGLLEGDVRRR
ncbi:MAG: CBS domain-containing protein [Nitrososphaeraceae archaeon]